MDPWSRSVVKTARAYWQTCVKAAGSALAAAADV
jgi:hypothetical protein